MIPSNLDEAVDGLLERYTPETLGQVKGHSLDKARIWCHLGLACWVRNEWIYPKGSPLVKWFGTTLYAESGFPPDIWEMLCEPDRISGIVTEALWHRLHDLEYVVAPFEAPEPGQGSNARITPWSS